MQSWNTRQAMAEQLFEMTSLCTNTGIESPSPLLHLLHSIGSLSTCSSISAADLPRPVLAFVGLVPAPLPNAVINRINVRAVGRPHVRSNEPGSFTTMQLHCLTWTISRCTVPAESSKLHQRCFGWLSVIPSANEKLSKFTITWPT